MSPCTVAGSSTGGPGVLAHPGGVAITWNDTSFDAGLRPPGVRARTRAKKVPAAMMPDAVVPSTAKAPTSDVPAARPTSTT
ncbi:MAG TPA: hypothetical protein VNJ02_04800 [Vicinamibacterales bacterium]|nr:hypothetical protein [Vicinamibacterales bacterium]